MTLFQGLATAAGYDPVRGPGSSCLGNEASGQCVLPWGSGTKEVGSIVLLVNGVSFAVRRFAQSITITHLPHSQTMALVLATIGPVADFRTFGRWLFLISNVICWATQFATISLTCGSQPLITSIGCPLSTILTTVSSEPLGCCDGIVHG